MTIPSPYYFVPLSDKIFSPDWAAQVSMDVPFKDGISGKIRVKVTAETPIYIRNSYKEKDTPAYNDFFRVVPNIGTYAVNGTTFKGMIRNIIEIASFGKFQHVEMDRHFSCRELSGSTGERYLERMVYTGPPVEPKARAGWLTKDKNGNWFIRPQEYARVEITDLIQYHRGNPNLRKIQPIQGKYKAWGRTPLQVRFDLSPIRRYTNYPDRANVLLQYKKAIKLGRGTEKEGTVVFTGQPQALNTVPHGKHMDFIFYPSDIPKDTLPVNEKVRRKFLQVHSSSSDSATGNWEYWQKRFDQGEEIPVFYLADEQDKPTDIGLAQMFKLPYEKQVGDLIKNVNSQHLEEFPLDLAEVMFGCASDKAGLRGRIVAEPFLATFLPPNEEQIVCTTLNSPRESFYPNYLEQSTSDDGEVDKYNDYDTENARPSGWKRYPAAVNRAQHLPFPPNRDMRISFQPLPKGATFEGDIFLHNVRPPELGALVWALNWGGDKRLRHNIGMGKPFGFGTIRVEIVGHELRACNRNVGEKELAAARIEFISMMDEWVSEQGIGNSWQDCEQLKELLSLADPKLHKNMRDDLRGYPSNVREFANFKRRRQALLRYTKQCRVR
jgi:CRISPR-associated protein (TIGR03986 family)